jgi:O-antigen/teichoic acid export membrane protein
MDVRRSYGYAYYDASIYSFDSALIIVASVFFGSAGAGVVALAQRLANRTAALRVAVDQVALASLSRVQRDPSRLKRAHGQGVLLHLLSTGVIISGVGFFAPVFLPLMGAEWAPAIKMLGLLCLVQLVATAFDLHGNILRVIERPAPPNIQRILQLVLTIGLALPLGHLYGVTGLGVAAVLATASYLVLEKPLREIFIPAYRSYLPWFFALAPFSLTAFVPLNLRPVLFLPGLVLLALPETRNDLWGHAKEAYASIRRR